MLNVAKKVEVDTKLNQILLSSITTLPTGNGDPALSNWKLAQSMMSCGLYEFQGWSSGHNIKNNSNLEQELFLMTYFSRNLDKFRGGKWHYRNLSGEGIAMIGVTRRLMQFMTPHQNYFVSAETPWMTRLEKFVTDFNVGVFRRTDEFLNPNYLQHKIQVGVWTWNGEHPPLAAFPMYVETTL